MKKRVLSLIMSVIMCMLLLPMKALHAQSVGYGSNGKFLAPIDSPIAASIPISTRLQLEAIRNNLSGKYHLVNDIDLYGTEWVPIGDNSTNQFTGTFDGQGHVISNMKITGDVQYAGLFGYIDNASIKNIAMERVDINVMMDTPANASVYHAYAGGICGRAIQSSISNCYNMGAVSAVATYVDAGGICGQAYLSITISNCYNTGSVYARGDRSIDAGGICGDGSSAKSYSVTSISNCYNTGAVTAYSTYSTFSSAVCSGGISGYSNESNISQCYNYGNVAANHSSSGNVSSGGILGCPVPLSVITNCYNAGLINATTSTGNADVGGISAGIIEGSEIRNCYNIGDLNAIGSNVNIGGLVGYNSSERLVACYAINLYGSTQGTRLTDTQMKNQSSFVGWNFSTIWDIDSGKNSGYPHLQSIPDIITTPGKQPASFSTQIVTPMYAPIFGNGKTLSSNIYWNDSTLFGLPSEVYNHDLARLSILLCTAAYTLDGSPQEMFIKTSLSNLRFAWEDIESFNNTGADRKDRVAHTFAHKTIACNSNEYNLVVIVIRGTTGNEEWLGNFDIGTGNIHAGFEKAKDSLINALSSYVTRLNSSLETKVLITGHSRGAGIANLLAKDLTDGSLSMATKDDIYAYTFATPKVARNIDNTFPNNLRYSNIFNFFHYDDFVPTLPLGGDPWNYGWYGKTFSFPSARYNDMAKEFERVGGRKFNPFNDPKAISKFENNVYNAAPSINAFYSSNQGFNLFSITPYEYFTDYLCDLLINGYAHWYNTLVAIIENMGQITSVYSPLSRFFVTYYQGDELLFAHAPDTYIAWMNALDREWIHKAYPSTVRTIEIACPVDVYVYDDDGRLIGTVIDDVINTDFTNPARISLSGITNDVKVLTLFAYRDYIIELVATDYGTMAYTVSDVDDSTGTVLSSETYCNIELVPDKTFISTVNASAFDEETSDTGFGTVLFSTTNSSMFEVNADGSETTVDKINVLAFSTDGGSVTGGGVFASGQHVSLEAKHNLGYEFDGWYENDIIVLGASNKYSFSATSNRKLEAHFKLSIPLAITTSSLPNGTISTIYKQSLIANGNSPITWSLDSGALPIGLTLSPTGVISGKPTVADTYYFTVRATNNSGDDQRELSITINTTRSIAVTTSGFDSLKVGQVVSDAKVIYTLTNGTFTSYITDTDFTIDGLPAGLSAGAVTRVNDTTVEVAVVGKPTIANAGLTSLTYAESIPMANIIDATVNIIPTGTISTGAIAKGDGAIADGVPVVNGIPTNNSITVNTVANAGTTGQSVEYAISTINDAIPENGWQSETTFIGLNPETSYFVYARTAENNNYNAGTAMQSVEIRTTNPIPPVNELSVSVTTPSIVETLAAYLNITVTGEKLSNKSLTAYLKVGNDLLYATPISDGIGRMFVSEAPKAGDYELVVISDDNSAEGSCLIEVTVYNTDIWEMNIDINEDGYVVLIFNETISAKDRTFDKEVQLNGKKVSCRLSDDSKRLITSVSEADLLVGENVFTATGVKYPRLFPSYSFTFTAMIVK